jgi:hypothetical protein
VIPAVNPGASLDFHLIVTGSAPLMGTAAFPIGLPHSPRSGLALHLGGSPIGPDAFNRNDWKDRRVTESNEVKRVEKE